MNVLEIGADVPDPLAPYLEIDRSTPRHECWVTGHMVSGLDGTAAVDGRVGALSTRPDQKLFRRMRQIADVVLVGAETARLEGYGPIRLSEQAQAERRALGKPPNPPIAVVSRSLEIDSATSLFADVGEDAPTMVVTCAGADGERRAEVEDFAEVIVAGEESVEPASALRAFADRGHEVVLCEGGPTWLGELVAADRLDELLLSISPMMGGDPLPVSVTPPGAGIARFGLKGIMAEDDTLFLRYEVEAGEETDR
ncbi:pyrimidine reductase family protein [Dietzia maris]|uniref:pyrimidine reductase family protein n=1 Tax=Dietzia maris TaxID=37915 RepID=UPI0037CBC232